MKKLILLIVLFVLRFSLCCFAENEDKIKFIVYENNHYKYMVNEKILLFYGGLIINNDDRIFLFKEDHSDKSAPARDREFAMMESNDAPVLTFYPERGHYMLWSYGVEADSSDFTIPEIIGEVYLEENFINEILANNFYWYILRDIPYSSTSREEYCEECKRRLREYYLPSLNKSQLRILRNTIYAYYGYLFASKDLRVFFDNRMKWYKPVDDFDESLIAKPHREFINLIKEFESKL